MMDDGGGKIEGRQREAVDINYKWRKIHIFEDAGKKERLK